MSTDLRAKLDDLSDAYTRGFALDLIDRLGKAEAERDDARRQIADPSAEHGNAPFCAGDVVRVHFAAGWTRDRTLTEGDADDMNAGENPCHPWRVARFERVSLIGERDRLQSAALSAVRTAWRDGYLAAIADHAEEGRFRDDADGCHDPDEYLDEALAAAIERGAHNNSPTRGGE